MIPLPNQPDMSVENAQPYLTHDLDLLMLGK